VNGVPTVKANRMDSAGIESESTSGTQAAVLHVSASPWKARVERFATALRECGIDAQYAGVWQCRTLSQVVADYQPLVAFAHTNQVTAAEIRHAGTLQ